MLNAAFSRIFIKGLLFSLPILLTITIMIWLVQTAEAMLVQPVRMIAPGIPEFPGMGIVIALILIYLIGLAVHGRVLRTALMSLQTLFEKMPVVSVVYSNISEMIEFVSGEKDGDLERVVLVELDDGIQLVGFVTQSNSNVVSDDERTHCAVYLPMSYQMGGYLVYVAESKLTTLDITKKQAMQRVLTADIGGDETKPQGMHHASS